MNFSQSNNRSSALRDSKVCVQEAPKTIQLVREVVDERLEMSPSFTEVANVFSISKRTLSRRLECAGVSYRDILTATRKRRACQYLRQTKLTVQEISTALGYSDCSNFVKAFKRWTGLTPRLYRVAANAGETVTP